MSARSSSDSSVRGTNDDATVSKMSCVKKGYFEDEFLHHFVTRAQKRPPLINRGYFSRVQALSQLLEQFLASPGEKQVLSLGAGFDTTFFHLAKKGRSPRRYIEVDFPGVTRNKAARLAKVPELVDLLGGGLECIDEKGGEIHTSGYHLIPADLRDLATFTAKLEAAGFDRSLPTYVLSECVLIYLPPEDAHAVVEWLGQLPSVAVVVYEQVRPDDPFGAKMVENLECRGCPLLGIHDVPTVEAQAGRFTRAGFARAGALDMLTIHRQYLDRATLARAERLEMFDEFEEWNMIQEHYCISWGVNDAGGGLAGVGFESGGAALLGAGGGGMGGGGSPRPFGLPMVD